MEILKGPGAFLNGMAPLGGVGGTINLVPKRAPNDPLNSITLGYHLQQSVRHRDRYRTAVRRQQRRWVSASTAPIPTAIRRCKIRHPNSVRAALAVDYTTERFRFSADLNYQKIHGDDPTRPVYFNSGFAIPQAPKNTASLGQPWYFADGQDTFGLVKAEVDVTDDVTLFASAGGRRNDFLGVYSFLTITDALGNASGRQYVQPTYSNPSPARWARVPS